MKKLFWFTFVLVASLCIATGQRQSMPVPPPQGGDGATPARQEGLLGRTETAAGRIKLEGTNQEVVDEIFQAFRQTGSAQREVLFKDGDFPYIIDSLRLTVDLEPWNYEDFTNLGWMYGNLQRKDMELVTYIRFRQLNPDDIDAPYPEAQFYFFTSQSIQVINLLEPTIQQELKPHPNTFRLLAHSYRRLGMYRDALRVWDELLKVTPGDLTAKNQRNRMAERLGLPRLP
ncbi:MAG: hypothetical protein MUC92_01655 [Fimbriimonadaceae bacterium]|jgi:tetratricopeptide (TPR) repeat protein|nr:hypothetical protein [Fimbriimonadaceae bacterium]